MNTNNIISHIEHTVAGIALVSVPLLINGIPDSWQTMTIGGVIGLVWSLARTYLTQIASN